MRFLQILRTKTIPEWAKCYYDYEYGKIFITFVKKTILVRDKINVCKKQTFWKHELTQEQLIKHNMQEERNEENQMMQRKFQKQEQLIVSSVKQANQLFYQYHRLNRNIVFLFLQMKLHELTGRLEKYQKWVRKVSQTKQIYISLLFNVYYQGKMLFKMCEINLIAYKKIQKKHIKNFEKYQLESPFFSKTRLKRSMDQLNTYFIRLQQLYLTIKEVYPKKARSELVEQMEGDSFQQSVASYLFGLTNGMSISLFVLIIIIYAGSQINDLSPQFHRDFPVWRLLIYIILYMWIFALNIVVFQKYRVNYQLVFDFKKMNPQSAFALALASIFTFIYLSFFTFYTLNITGLLIAESNIIYYFPLIIWGIAFVYLLNPFPIFNFEGRIFFFKQLLMAFLSPFFLVQFNVIWIIDQFISMILPFSDITYTFCYYINVNLDDPNSTVCDSYLHTAEYFGILIFLIRMIQSIRVCIKNQRFINTREMYLIIRCAFCVLLLLVSLLSQVEQKLAYLWCVMVVPLFIYNYYVDLKWDWGLGQVNCKHFLLRKQLAFQPKQYYIIMVVNLIFRIAWILTLSQQIIYHYIQHPTYVILAIAMIQIIRRCFWNIIKVERQWVLNSQNFQVRIDYKQKQDLVQNEVEGFHQNYQDEKSIQHIRHEEEIKNLRQQLQLKRVFQNKILQWSNKKTADLYKIEQEIDGMITQIEKKQK